jgi:hypothetical protein
MTNKKNKLPVLDTKEWEGRLEKFMLKIFGKDYDMENRQFIVYGFQEIKQFIQQEIDKAIGQQVAFTKEDYELTKKKAKQEALDTKECKHSFKKQYEECQICGELKTIAKQEALDSYKRDLVKKIEKMKIPFTGEVHGGDKCPTCSERTDAYKEIISIITG